MPRPKSPRCLNFSPDVYYFKPRGIPLRELEEVVLLADEVEAVKLHDADGLEQIAAAEKMNISQPTFARTLDAAYKKIADALINGKAIRIENISDIRKGL
ncbi:MAG: DUF134 domain-containing protein [bacterium]|nr:DUF134 domain-containing protein [bacterium]